MIPERAEHEPAHEDLLAALETLGLFPPVGWTQIRSAYRRRARALHPDRNPGADAAEAMAELNRAYRLLQGYVESFRYRFDEAEYLEQHPRERLRRQFRVD